MKRLACLAIFAFVVSAAVLWDSAASAGEMNFKEAPMLAAKVAKGELPPIAERLPKNPLIVDKDYFEAGTMDNWQPGKFGGELRLSHNEPNNAPDVFFIIMQPIIRLANGLSDSDIQANICEFLGASDDNKEFTFRIRDGLRWSDGVPVTTEDVRFAYEDVTLNPELTSLVPNWLNLAGLPGKLEIVDELTFKFRFPESNGIFVKNVMFNEWVEYSRIIKPSHYLKQFHSKYATPEEIARRIKESDLGEGSTWLQLYLLKDAYNREITSRKSLGMPMLTPWHLVSIDNEVFVYERNPYYHKVDSSGQQLPYLDRIVSPKVQDGEMENVRMISGEADILRRNAALIKMPLYKANESQGNYTTLMLQSHLKAPATIFFNYGYPDLTARAIMNDVRFRKAVSLGIDKQEIIDSVYLGFGEIPTYTYGEYDPAEANRLLDEMGMKIGPNGVRTAPDGSPFLFLVENGGEAVDLPGAAEIAAAHLREHLNLNAEMRQTDTTMFTSALWQNKVMSRMHWGFDMNLPEEYTTRPLYFNSIYNLNYMKALRAGQPTDKPEMIEPADWIKEGFMIYDKFMKLSYGTPEYEASMAEQKKYYHDNVMAVPLIMNPLLPLPLSNRLGNTPTGGYQIAALMVLEHYYVK